MVHNVPHLVSKFPFYCFVHFCWHRSHISTFLICSVFWIFLLCVHPSSYYISNTNVPIPTGLCVLLILAPFILYWVICISKSYIYLYGVQESCVSIPMIHEYVSTFIYSGWYLITLVLLGCYVEMDMCYITIVGFNLFIMVLDFLVLTPLMN